jgi:hypothetical protein
MAHGRTQTIRRNWKDTFGQGNVMSVLQPKWQRMCEPRKARQIYEDGIITVEDLHQRAGLKGKPFGTMAKGSATATLPHRPK